MPFRTIPRHALVGALTATLAGCGGDSGTDPDTGEAVGTWSLRTVNGQSLPITVQQTQTARLDVTDETFVFLADSTFTEEITVRTTSGSQVTEDTGTDTGTYTVRGNTITVTFDSDDTSQTGTLSGNDIRIATAGFVLIYSRQ